MPRFRQLLANKTRRALGAHTARGRRGRIAALFFALVGISTPGLAAELTLRGAWSPVQAHDSSTSLALGDHRLRYFNPAREHEFADPNGEWVLLWPEHGAWPRSPRILEIDTPWLLTARYFPPGSNIPRSASLSSSANGWPGHDRLAFLLESMPVGNQPLRLQVTARAGSQWPVTIAVRPVGDFLRVDARELAFASACLAIMAAMVLIALFFSVWLRDIAYIYYAIFMSAYAVDQSIATGFVFDPLGWQVLAGAPLRWEHLAAGIVVVFAILFLSRFAALARHAPVCRRVLLGFAAVFVMLDIIGQIPLLSIVSLIHGLAGTLLIFVDLAIPFVALWAALRGSRYAIFFLIGWLPLLLVSAFAQAQFFGWALDWTWRDQAYLGAGAFEAVVLALGLADRSLAMRREHDRIQRLADIDSLTGLYNRRAWSRRITDLVETARLKHEPLCLLFLDLDHFKAINDSLGHDGGDRALQNVAEMLREELRREADKIGRYGGEEFVVALPGVNAARAEQIAERIRQRLQSSSLQNPTETALTVSIGVAVLQEGETIQSLIKRADQAMYAAKTAGRNRVVRFEDEFVCEEKLSTAPDHRGLK